MSAEALVEGTVTRHFATAKFDFSDSREETLSFRQGALVEVLTVLSSGW